MDQNNIIEINTRLEDYYGQLDNKPKWRVSWSDDQFETRYGDFEDRNKEGTLIRCVGEWRQLPKYRQYINPGRWLLERLMEMPSFTSKFATKLSYECLFAFKVDQIPNWVVVRAIVETVNKNMEQAGIYTKYKDPDRDPKEAEANKEARLQGLEEALFGNETETGDALAYRQGVGFTTSKIKEGNNA